MAELSSLQRLHYAANRYALLLIFQGMDAAGRDGAIRHVVSNPQGCQVSSFKQPSAEELEHNFLCARHAGFPSAARIGARWLHQVLAAMKFGRTPCPIHPCMHCAGR